MCTDNIFFKKNKNPIFSNPCGGKESSGAEAVVYQMDLRNLKEAFFIKRGVGSHRRERGLEHCRE